MDPDIIEDVLGALDVNLKKEIVLFLANTDLREDEKIKFLEFIKRARDSKFDPRD